MCITSPIYTVSFMHFHSSQDGGATTHMYHLWRGFLGRFFSFFKEQHCYLAYWFKSSRSARERLDNHRLTVDWYDEVCFLTVATFKTIYEGFFKRRSVTNTANFFHSCSDWSKQKDMRRTGRGGGGDQKYMWERNKKKRAQALIYVYWFLPLHWFPCLLHPFRSRHLTGGYSAWS